MKRTVRVRGAALGVVVALALPTAPLAEPSVLHVVQGLPSADIAVVQDRGLVVESAVPFAEVSVAQPEIADVSPLSDRTLYVVGKSRGITSLTLLGDGGRLIANVAVRVTPDVATLQGAIDAVLAE